jgi:serine/threonine protein kinase
MSPEQADLNQLDIDTRSDVYSLGVMLYELLTGTTPISRKQMREAGFVEMLRQIGETEPPKPSSRLSESSDGTSETAKRLKSLRGDLDWVVMRALEKNPGRRSSRRVHSRPTLTGF